MAYIFDFIDRDGRVDHFDLGEFVNDETAERAAQDALLESHIAAYVLIWQGERKVARVDSALVLRG